MESTVLSNMVESVQLHRVCVRKYTYSDRNEVLQYENEKCVENVKLFSYSPSEKKKLVENTVDFDMHNCCCIFGE